MPVPASAEPGRHHLGNPGDIISERPGDFLGIRSLTAKTDGVRELTLGHPEAVSHSLHRNLPTLVDEC